MDYGLLTVVDNFGYLTCLIIAVIAIAFLGLWLVQRKKIHAE
jgi:hypothetical protein